ncbi:MAG: hypothetical protein KKC19_03470 [Nanoarchaeota archaeon]|nr:hypothetical protein [Nanoarchaeota archaeon]
MDKLKIKGISSESYPGGRLDIFRIALSEGLVFNMESLFKALGFDKGVINDLDMHYPSTRGRYFFYSSNVKAHLFFEEDELDLIFDTSLPREKINRAVEKYFEFPKDK